MTTNAPPSRDPANDDSLTGAFKLILRKMTQNLDDMLPCIVISHDRANNRVQVRPAVKMVDTLGNQHRRDIIASVPVLNLGSGGFFVNFNITEGSLGWIKASDRDIGLFLQSYKEEIPNTQRMHRFSDGLFIPDVMTGYTIDDEDADAMVIQNLDGSVKISLNEERIKLTAPNIEAIAVDEFSIIADTFTVTAPNVNVTASVGINLNGVIIGPDGAASSPVSFTAPNLIGTTNVTFGGISGIAHAHANGTRPDGNTGGPIS